MTLTRPFFIGLFEVTQQQYALVTGSDPCASSEYGQGDAYPVHYVSYDMHGNVWKQCLDWNGTRASETEPQGPASGMDRIRRGSCWQYMASLATSSYRYNAPSTSAKNHSGFRLAWSLELSSGATLCFGTSAPMTIPPVLTNDATQTTEVPVPYSWLRVFYPDICDEYEAYETADHATASNGVNKVWQCYVAGLDPTEPAARFTATITMDVNGKPEISHDPPLSVEENAKREYRTLGSDSLDAPEPWSDVTDVQDLDAAGYRFFKVTVRLRE